MAVILGLSAVGFFDSNPIHAALYITTSQTQPGGVLANGSGELVIGHGTNNPLITLTSAATTSGVEAVVVGSLDTEEGFLRIESGSVLTNSGTGSITGSFGVLSSIYRGYGYVALNDGSTGEVTVTGAGSKWENSEVLVVGYFGHGKLAIENGGLVKNKMGIVGDANTSVGEVTVTGAGSRWENTEQLYVGIEGRGTLNIENGGLVKTTYGYVSAAPGVVGEVTVTGAGSTWESPSFVVGYGPASDGKLTIESGGVVKDVTGYLGMNSGALGEATVTGAGSKWENLQELHVGNEGEAILTIENGGLVTNTQSLVGRTDGSTGKVTVTGLGSTWTNSGDLILGGADLLGASTGSGTLDILDHGLVTVTGTTKVYGGDTINLNGGTLVTHDFDFSAGAFNFTAGTLTATGGTVIGNVVVPAGGLVTGTGHFTNLTIAGAISPGSSPETISATTGEWQGGGSYLWEINALPADGGSAGSSLGWDLLNFDDLSITSSSGNPFTIDVRSLDPLDTDGDLTNFDPEQPYSFLIATDASGAFIDISGVLIDASGFSNNLNGGTFGLSAQNGGTELYLVFTPLFDITELPEPASAALWGMVILSGALAWRWRRRGPVAERNK